MVKIDDKIISGLKWTSFSALFQLVLQTGVWVFVARMLTSSDLGLLAVIGVILSIGVSFKDMGTSAAVIHYQDMDNSSYNAFWWFNVYMGIGITLLLMVLSPIVGWFYELKKLTLYLVIASLSIFIHSFSHLYATLLRKELEFKSLELSSMVSFIAGSTLTLAGLYYQKGLWAVVIGRLFNDIVFTVMVILSGRRFFIPAPHHELLLIKPYLRFSMFQIGDQLINRLNADMDKVLIGKFLEWKSSVFIV
ncbi:MAG: oligosaccharide flippase family protein [Saprospiraceae bacterium]